MLGKNGAGKTTTIKMLTLQLKPTSGNIFFPAESALEVKSLIGLVPQHLNFDQDLTVGENLELHARLHHLPSAERKSRIEELLRFVELESVRNSFVKNLSGGMKRRLLIVRALIHIFRRTDCSTRPASPPKNLGTDSAAQGAGNHNRAHDALYRRGGISVRPRGDSQRGKISRAGFGEKSLRRKIAGGSFHRID